jgi:hypothetical protein
MRFYVVSDRTSMMDKFVQPTSARLSPPDSEAYEVGILRTHLDATNLFLNHSPLHGRQLIDEQ